MQGIARMGVAVGAIVVIGAALSACSKKDNYAADTAAAVDSTSAMSASSTAPTVQDTATTAATTTKTTTTKSTAKKAPKKATY